MEHSVSLLLLSLLLSDTLDGPDEIAFVVELEQLLVAILSKACLDQAAQNDLNAMHCLFIHDGVNFVPDIPDVLRSWR